MRSFEKNLLKNKIFVEDFRVLPGNENVYLYIVIKWLLKWKDVSLVFKRLTESWIFKILHKQLSSASMLSLEYCHYSVRQIEMDCKKNQLDMILSNVQSRDIVYIERI